MSTTEAVLRDILEQHAIGAAKVGGEFSVLAHCYGEPTEMIVDVKREYGFDERCKIYDYDEMQVWSDAYDTIDRIFFKTNFEKTRCTNQNFISDMADIRDKLKGCDIEIFERVLDDSRAKISQTSALTQLSFKDEDIEIFAIFQASGVGGPHQLSMLRLNSFENPNGSRASE